jgi:hypothetical protein
LLVRSGGACLVLAGAGTFPAVAYGQVPALSAPREATLSTVLGAIAEDPATGLAPSAVEHTVGRFVRFYEAAPPPFKAYADDTLDRVEAGSAGVRFSALSARTAREVLRSWAAAGPADAEVPDRHRALAASALSLASLTFEEDELRQVGYVLAPAGQP